MIARKARQQNLNVKTIFGGVHVSAVPQRVIKRPEVDYLCVGEGDKAFGEILDVIQRRGMSSLIDNVWFKSDGGEILKGGMRSFLQDLDSLPIFDKTLWENVVSFKDIYFTMASRGCPYQCSYCFNDYFAGLGFGKYVRYRSPEHVIKELKWAKKRYQLRLIEFEDDVFTLNKAWLKNLMNLYRREINLPFQCLTHPKCMDDDVALVLKESGCRFVQMGIQSMDDEYKRSILKRPETSRDVHRALESMTKAGLQVKIDHMFALPGEPIEAQEKALKIYQKYPLYRMQTFWMNYFPRTSILNIAIDKGIVSYKNKNRIEDGLFVDNYRNSQKMKDRDLLHQYQAYECVFKLLTVLPKWILRHLSINGFKCLPKVMLSAITFFIDLVSGLVKNNPDHWAYAKYYMFHVWRRIVCFFERPVTEDR